MLIDGNTEVIAHLGYPTHAFKAPLIYNPYFERAGISALVVGCGGVGSAIAAALADAGIGAIVLFDVNAASAAGLAQRLTTHYAGVDVHTGANDPAGFDLVVNATPLGMNADDPLPVDA